MYAEGGNIITNTQKKYGDELKENMDIQYEEMVKAHIRRTGKQIDMPQRKKEKMDHHFETIIFNSKFVFWGEFS